MMNIYNKEAKQSDSRQIRLFLAAEGVLYLTFLIGDLAGMPTDGIKFLSIGLCTWLAAARARRSREWFVPAALTLTLAADACLLFGGDYLIGVLCFCGVQALYAARLMWLRGKVRRFTWKDHVPSVAWRVFLYGASLVVVRLVAESTGTDLLTPLYMAALKSFCQLSVNAAEAWHLLRFEPRVRTFAVGLGLFWACDLCVGLRYVLAGSAMTALRSLIGYGIWFFYLPAQVCIALAGTTIDNNRRNYS